MFIKLALPRGTQQSAQDVAIVADSRSRERSRQPKKEQINSLHGSAAERRTSDFARKDSRGSAGETFFERGGRGESPLACARCYLRGPAARTRHGCVCALPAARGPAPLPLTAPTLRPASTQPSPNSYKSVLLRLPPPPKRKISKGVRAAARVDWSQQALLIEVCAGLKENDELSLGFGLGTRQCSHRPRVPPKTIPKEKNTNVHRETSRLKTAQSR